MNPTYYNLEDTSTEAINKFLSEKVDATLSDLEVAHWYALLPFPSHLSLSPFLFFFWSTYVILCSISIDEAEQVVPQTLGRIASFYYLHYTTMKLFHDNINADNDLNSILQVLCDAGEYDELPVRHNEVWKMRVGCVLYVRCACRECCVLRACTCVACVGARPIYIHSPFRTNSTKSSHSTCHGRWMHAGSTTLTSRLTCYSKLTSPNSPSPSAITSPIPSLSWIKLFVSCR